MLDLLATVLSVIFAASAVVMVVAQARYLGRFREVHGRDPLRGERFAERPWLFFGEMSTVLRETFDAYDTIQGDAELEGRRRTLRRWKFVTFSAFGMLLTLSIVRLLGFA
jgi:hypothetical protein